MTQSKTNVYVPIGGSVYPGHTKQETAGNQQGMHAGITTSILRAIIPGVNLHQTTQLNGVLVDTSTPGVIR